MRTERRPRRLVLGLLGVTLFGALGCPGTLTDKERFLVDAATPDDGGEAQDATPTDAGDGNPTGCSDIVTRIFQPQCGNSGCHGAVAPQEGLDLVSAGVAARVVGVAGKECSGKLADPAMPEASLIYTKLTAQPPCGAQMPLAQPPLNSADTVCVLAWIAAQ